MQTRILGVLACGAVSLAQEDSALSANISTIRRGSGSGGLNVKDREHSAGKPKDPSYKGLNGGGLRSEASNQPGAMASIMGIGGGYGCWCYFGKRFDTSKGPPVDEYDANCQVLYHGYECILIDAELDGEDCTPWDTDYEQVDVVGTDHDTIRTQCAQRNAGNCKIRACIVESNYLMVLNQLFAQSLSIDTSYKHNNAAFVLKDHCPGTVDSVVERDVQCCGTEPLRKPYNAFGPRICCAGFGTYNPAVFDCCDNGIQLTCPIN